VSLSTNSTNASAVPNYGQGYVMIGQDGGSYAYGNAPNDGSIESVNSGATAESWLGHPINSGAASPAMDGYWMMTSAGQTCAFGSARGAYPTWTSGTLTTADSGTNWCFEAPSGITYAGTPIAIAGYSDDGYWQVTSTGAVYAIGAPSYGNAPAGNTIVAIAATADRDGYWLVASNGAVFAFGDAQYIGGMNGSTLSAPIVGITGDPVVSTAGHTGNDGYWLVGADGGVYAFNAPFDGSTGGTALDVPITSGVASMDGGGYMMASQDGGGVDFGDYQFQGSQSGTGLSDSNSTPNGVVAIGNL
jgi:hypothetical protein